MQTDETSGDHIINGFVLPPTRIVGEAMNNKFAHQLTSRVSSPNNDFYGIIQSGNAAMTFSSSPPMSTFHGNDQYMEGIPLLNASIEIQEKLAIPAPLGSPLENTKYGLATNGLDIVSSSLEMMLHGYGGLPFPPELVERAVGKASLPTAQPARSCYSRGWPMMEQVGLSSTSQDSSQLSNELSLSLVTSRPSALNGHSIHEQCSELSSNRVATTYSLHDRQILPEHTSCSSSSKISGSRFVEAMQEILAEFACYALENIQDIGVNASLSSTSIEGDHSFMLQKQEMSLEAKKKHLLTLLQMVDDQYSQFLDAVHTVTSAFHAVTELEPNLHARFALPAISFMYKSLRERISSHILAIGAHQKEGETRENKSFDVCFIQKQWALQQQQQLSKRDHHQLWRPQRGLPETSVSILRTWMFQNFLHPYPKDSEKHLLALKSGLTRNQVSNWFINARVRLWKPMIEEMCAEMNRRKARKEDDGMEGNHRNQMRFETRSFTRD